MNGRSSRNRPALLVVLFSLMLPACQAPSADALDAALRRGELRWGADEEGGGPYVYRGQAGLVGFEFELMDYLSDRLGVKSNFVQCQWDDLLKMLTGGNVDVVVNGYELTPERLRTCIATIPYYVYELHLLCRSEDDRLQSWDDLRRSRPGGGKWRVGVLTGTAAEKYLTNDFTGQVELVQFSGTADAFRDVNTRGLDATVTDTPAAVFYGPKFQTRSVGRPTERGYYVMYLRPGQERLRDRLNDGICAAIDSGKLKEVFTRYGIWNELQMQLAMPETQRLPDELRPEGLPESGWAIVVRDFPLLLEAAWMTVKLSVLSMPIAVVLGLAIALGRMYGLRAVRWPLAVYVEVIRGTPLMLQLLFLYFGVIPLLNLPDQYRHWGAFMAAVTGLAVNYSAYEAEIYRAGLQAIPVGQTEAALALGLSRRQAIWHIVVPQAVRLVVPPVANDFINLFKDTSVCSVITIVELSKRYNTSVNDDPHAFVELALVTAVLYLVMSYPLSILTRRLERKTTLARA